MENIGNVGARTGSRNHGNVGARMGSRNHGNVGNVGARMRSRMGSRNHGNVGARTESRKRRKRRNGDGDRMETKIETENMVHNTWMENVGARMGSRNHGNVGNVRARTESWKHRSKDGITETSETSEWGWRQNGDRNRDRKYGT
jgi:hypothetical protein